MDQKWPDKTVERYIYIYMGRLLPRSFHHQLTHSLHHKHTTMTRLRYARKNIFHFRVLEHKNKSLAVCFSASANLLPVSYVANDEEVGLFLETHFSFSKDTTVVIVDRDTDRKYSITSNQKLVSSRLSRNVQLVVPSVFQSTGDSYKNLSFPFQVAHKYLRSGYPLANAVEHGLWGANCKKAWIGIDLDNFDEELDSIQTASKPHHFVHPNYHPTHYRCDHYHPANTKLGFPPGLHKDTLESAFLTREGQEYEFRTGWVPVKEVARLGKLRAGY